MKRILVLLSFVTMFFVAQGQEIVRSANHYTVDGVTYATSTAFRGYLKNTNSELFAQYNHGYKLGMTGWGLFAFGLVIGATTYPWVYTQIAPVMLGLQASVGFVLLATGTTLICVGYHKMHKSVDDYIIRQKPSPYAYWTLNASSNDIGIACHF